MMTIDKLTEELDAICPEPKCALFFSNPFECLVAVLLSAQTTDRSVNKVTPDLFRKYPNPIAMAEADISDIESIIKSIGIYKIKAKNLVKLASTLTNDYDGEVPSSKEILVSLPGVGVKTANVVLAECFSIPAIAVDTHVSRVSKRLGLAKEGDDPLAIEKKLEKLFPKEHWIKTHHQLIFFGRNVCHAKYPSCCNCPFRSDCLYLKKASKTAGR